MSSMQIDSGFDDAVGAVGEEVVGVPDAAERVVVGYQMGGIGDAVVHIAPLAIETLAAERLDIHSDAIARLDLGFFRTYGLNDANQFMPYGNPGLRLRHSPMQKRLIY